MMIFLPGRLRKHRSMSCAVLAEWAYLRFRIE